MAFPTIQPPAGAIPPTSAPIGTPNSPNALQGGYTTPSGIPALPRPQLQMSASDVKEWFGRLTKDKARRDLEKPKRQALRAAYDPPSFGSDYTDLNSNIHFRNVRVKTASLWTQMPDLVLTPNGPLKGIPQLDQNGQPVVNPQTQQPQMASPDGIVSIKRAFLTKDLGRDGANVNLTVKQCLFDYQQTSGNGPSKICYESDVKYIEPTPSEVPGSVLGLSQPTPQQPVVVNERRRWFHFSPEQLIIPAGFLSIDWDHAPYLGMEFETPDTPQNRKAYNLPDDFRSTQTQTDKALSSDNDRSAQVSQKVIKGTEIWLHACDFDPTEPDKDVFYRLVLIEGLKDRAAVYELSPYQDKGLDGRLTTDSMIGNPIHPLTLRVGGETAYPQSDAAFTNPLVNIENRDAKWDALRSEANVSRFAHASSISSAIDKLRNAGQGQGVAIDDAIMARGKNALIWELPHLEQSQSDVRARELNRQAIQETLGLGANQAGAFSREKKSATEVATVQANVSGPLQAERIELMDWYLKGVTKYDALVMRYETERGYVQVVGRDGFQQLAAYTNAHLSGKFSYDAHPDSQISVDQATRIKRATDYTNFVAKSPASNQVGTVRMVTREFGYNAAELVHEIPPPPPPAPSANLAIKVEDLAVPEMRQVIAILFPQLAPALTGPISPEAIQAAINAQSTPAVHGGAMPKADKVDKHTAEETGNQVGAHPLSGAPAQTPPQAVPRMVQ